MIVNFTNMNITNNHLSS